MSNLVEKLCNMKL